ncbi:hypothetical protein A1342_14710 [Methylomonas methanica]|uniref:Response regulatory domain-containing protein n=1 Tax=Methylomonas denitrificans TaxID=1538553 RepID=A0A126T241_9GAMM|nr:hypothetical protein JT25_004565 [Methylomonas denitrificans]OAH98244.1 hypothetical protein A1342_14710 [Methylomonas methanica]
MPPAYSYDIFQWSILTGLSEAGDEAEGFEAGAVYYLHKPVSPRILLARVNTHLSLVSAIQLEQSQRDAVFMLSEAGHKSATTFSVEAARRYSGWLPKLRCITKSVGMAVIIRMDW